VYATSLYLDGDNPSKVELDLDRLRFVGMDDGPVPEFRVSTLRGDVIDSGQLVGEEPFLVVFFATWCKDCTKKLPALRRALDNVGDIEIVGASLDETENAGKVEGYLARYDLDFPVVRASSHPEFWMSYNYFMSVPLVVVVGRNGGLVDYQLGYEPNDQQRLETAVELARVIGPLAPD
jgi:peroxiredoxin